MWKQIKDFKDYEVNENGEIRSLKHGKETILKGRLSKDGYLRYALRKNGKAYEFKGHRLVAEAFIPNPENKPTINHINGDKTCNKKWNLEWATREEQMKHAYRLGLKKPVNCPHRKLTNEQVLEIRKIYKAHSKDYGMIALAKKYKVSGATIKRCVNNIYYKDIK